MRPTPYGPTTPYNTNHPLPPTTPTILAPTARFSDRIDWGFGYVSAPANSDTTSAMASSTLARSTFNQGGDATIADVADDSNGPRAADDGGLRTDAATPPPHDCSVDRPTNTYLTHRPTHRPTHQPSD